MINKIFVGDNLFGLDKIQNNSVGICYIDPPYNTGNIFNYNDNIEKAEWCKNISNRIIKIKDKLVKNGVVIFSISEESLFDAHTILKNNFKYVFEPLIWQTKNSLNQNKVTNISSINHEYILIASDEKIKTNLEDIDSSLIVEKISNYPLSINLIKDISLYESEIVDNKKIYIIPKNMYEIGKNNVKTSFRGHFFQKRTAQIGHGAIRYINLVKNTSSFDKDTLFFIDGVKDKQNLGGKFILNNSYFQSINQNELKMKMPSLLGFYQGGINGFQTAKPIELIKRLIRNFNIYNDLPIIDLYSGSGNVLKGINELGLNFYGFEIGENDKNLTLLKKNIINIENVNFEILN